MQKEILPTGKIENSKLVNALILEAVLATVGNSQGGLFLEVDLEYLERLHKQ